MKKRLFVLLIVLLAINTAPVAAGGTTSEKDFVEKYYFDVDLKGLKEVYFFREFPYYDEKGQITPLGKAFLTVLTSEVWTWVREPRIYIKEDVAYIHAVQLDGLNILYTLKKDNGSWKVVKTEAKKIPTIGSEVILEKAFLRAIGTEILKATKTYYGESRLFNSERIININRDIRNGQYEITVQIVTFEGPHNPPYGFDTITFRLPGWEILKYDHKNVSEIGLIPLATH